MLNVWIFTYWWSCIGKGLPCSLRTRLGIRQRITARKAGSNSDIVKVGVDTIGISQAGYKAAQFNNYMNVKSADKYLQFGYDKCRAMVVGKKSESYHIPKLQVDTWNTHHTKEGGIIEYFAGKKDMQVCGGRDIFRWAKYEIYS